MGKVQNPYTFSDAFKIDPEILKKLGVFDPTLSADTRLFIDPLLFAASAHPEFSTTAVSNYQSHFETVIKHLRNVKEIGDVSWRAAYRLLRCREMRGTCLGYGAGSINGSAWGPALTRQVLDVGKQVVDLGITDPDLFPSLALFEENIGPDRIGDMAAHVAVSAIAAFNRRILDSLGLKGEEFDEDGLKGIFLVNPHQSDRTPIVLIPTDILRRLPVAADWDSIASAATESDSIRDRVNEHIGHIWALKTKRDGETLKKQATASAAAYQALLDAIHSVKPAPYDSAIDPDGLVKWAHLAKAVVGGHPLDLSAYKKPNDLDAAFAVVGVIVARFRELVELRGLWRELYKENGKPRHESTAQRLFFAVAYCYCEANNLDISPEVDTGSGKIDFKFSNGFNARVLVEIKLSSNQKVVQGFETQLEVYKVAEKTARAFYVVIDVGLMGKKDAQLTAVRNAASGRGEPVSKIEFIDGLPKKSASKMDEFTWPTDDE